MPDQHSEHTTQTNTMVLPDDTTPGLSPQNDKHQQLKLMILMQSFEELCANLASTTSTLTATREALDKLKARPDVASETPDMQAMFAKGMARNEQLLLIMEEFIPRLGRVFDET